MPTTSPADLWPPKETDTGTNPGALWSEGSPPAKFSSIAELEAWFRAKARADVLVAQSAGLSAAAAERFEDDSVQFFTGCVDVDDFEGTLTLDVDLDKPQEAETLAFAADRGLLDDVYAMTAWTREAVGVAAEVSLELYHEAATESEPTIVIRVVAEMSPKESVGLDIAFCQHMQQVISADRWEYFALLIRTPKP